jgi:hypothetical protein
MTEAEWLATRSSHELLKFIDQERLGGKGKFRTRKLRLMRCSSFRTSWELLPDDVLRQAVLVAEQFADGECGLELLLSARREVALTAHWLKSPFVEGCYRLLDPTAKRRAVDYGPHLGSESRRLCDCIRDIFGNPFRPVSFDPDWRTSTAVALARQMYDARDFSAMPILADALEDAECDNEDVLSHCRAVDGVHVRGCWVVDLVLGKS